MQLLHKRDDIRYECMHYIYVVNGTFAAIHAAVIATSLYPYPAVEDLAVSSEVMLF